VVSYNATVALDTADERVKPGMSATASIIIDVATNVLIVPNAAVKTDDTGSYVEIIASSASGIPTRQTVETGLSDDTYTEIKNGLKEGDMVVTGTTAVSSITSSSATPANQRAGGFMFGGPGR